MENILGTFLEQVLGVWSHTRTPGKEGDGLRGHCPPCPLSLTLLCNVYFPILSVPLSSSIYFLSFFLPFFPVLPPCHASLTRPCSVWLSQAAGVKHPLSGLYPRRSWFGAACAARTSSVSQPGRTQLGRKGAERAADSLRQSTPPAHTIQSRSISALAWRRAPRAIPDLNVLFVRLALGRSSPSARAWLALTPGTSSLCSAQLCPCSPPREHTPACNSCGPG